MDARTLLVKTAERIEQHGWHRNGWVPDEVYARFYEAGAREALTDCAACAGGAMALVISNNRDWSPSFVPGGLGLRSACELLCRTLGLDTSRSLTWLDAVIDWNDRAAQSAEEVVAALRAAAVSPLVPTGRMDCGQRDGVHPGARHEGGHRLRQSVPGARHGARGDDRRPLRELPVDAFRLDGKRGVVREPEVRRAPHDPRARSGGGVLMASPHDMFEDGRGSRSFTAKFPGICDECLGGFERGEEVQYDEESNLIHANPDDCETVRAAHAPARAVKQCERCFLVHAGECF